MKYRSVFSVIFFLFFLSSLLLAQPISINIYTFDATTFEPTYIRNHLGQPLAERSLFQVIVDSLQDGIDPPLANGRPGGDDRLYNTYWIGAGSEMIGTFALSLQATPIPWRVDGYLYEGQHFYLRAFETFNTPIPSGTYYNEILNQGLLFVVPHGDTDFWNISSDTMRVTTGLQWINPTYLSRLVIGTNFLFRWSNATFPGNVQISLNRNYPLGNWETLFDSTANDFSENWLVTAPVTGLTSRVRIRSVLDTAIQVISDRINVTHFGLQEPFANNALRIGDTTQLQWQTSPIATGNVRFLLNRYYPTGTWDTLIASTPNDMNEAWVVTGPYTNGATARLRIESTTDPNIFDESRLSFSLLPTLELLQPNGGELLEGNSLYPIRWRSEGTTLTDSVLVEVNSSLFGSWQPIEIARDSLVWLVPSITANDVRIRISYLPEAIRAIQDSSDAAFQIVVGNIDATELPLPGEYRFEQAYPNPFNATTSFKVAVPRSSDVTLALYNMLGQKVIDLHNGNLKAGWHRVSFRADHLSSGSYIVKMDAPGFSNSQLIQLVK
ncbi:MAG: T9SS type A sorting domain-containing protein [bacterium]|nr:T9SS type A sorting domain-containing protein [bacterium]